MTFHDTGGPAPAYRLAPDTRAEIAADLARLTAEGIAPSASAASGLGPKTGPGRIAFASASPSRRLALFGGAAALLARPAAARVAEADAELARFADELGRTLDDAAAPWTPNAETLAAIADAEAGRVVEVTLDELRAEILADDGDTDGGAR